MVQLYNTKDHAIIIKKGIAVAQMMDADKVPKTVVADGMSGPFKPEGGSKKAMQNSPSKKKEKSCLKSWSSQVLSPGWRKTRRRL